MSVTFYTDLSAENIMFRAEGNAEMDVTAYRIAKDR
jgi:hypothetical protein